MAKFLDVTKQYKVNGVFLDLMAKIKACYEQPTIIYKTSEITKEQIEMMKDFRYIPSNDNEEVTILPFPAEISNFLIGKLISEFEKCEWEEV